MKWMKRDNLDEVTYGNIFKYTDKWYILLDREMVVYFKGGWVFVPEKMKAVGLDWKTPVFELAFDTEHMNVGVLRLFQNALASTDIPTEV